MPPLLILELHPTTEGLGENKEEEQQKKAEIS